MGLRVNEILTLQTGGAEWAKMKYQNQKVKASFGKSEASSREV